MAQPVLLKFKLSYAASCLVGARVSSECNFTYVSSHLQGRKKYDFIFTKKKPQKSSGPHLLISLWNLPAHHLRITESIAQKHYATIVTTKMPQCSKNFVEKYNQMLFFSIGQQILFDQVMVKTKSGSSTGKFSYYPNSQITFQH